MSMMPNVGALMGGAMPQYGSIIQQLMGAPPPGFDQQQNEQQNFNPRGSAILSLLSQQGGAQLQQNQQGFQNEEAKIQQDMMSKGLANTSVGDNLNQEANNQLMQQNAAVNQKTGMSIADMAARLLPGAGGAGGAKAAGGMVAANPYGVAPANSMFGSTTTMSTENGNYQRLNNGMWRDPSGMVSPNSPY